MPEWETMSHQCVIGGFVRDAAKQVIADVALSAQRAKDGAVVAHARTGEDGSYFFVDLMRGPCMIAVNHQGLQCEVLAEIGDYHQEDFRMLWLDLELPAPLTPKYPRRLTPE
ncbi:carboxypeptidase regulatory-like domain-containing protein [Terriglobus albidus]|uniref:Carboxypeptidase regulatory-like domain-containing protein n=1 Tax=Terriglobus albidus TaxID=1592106 RepID=A0A5B9EGX2_9BACT|nr:carboxypeptidase-like regulatory domain-containing protein [Terriglobus albidus]QEE29671.1 carboxypeptidase regulatory-like domain-containing protein [Terriglobus albidus]